MKSMTLVYIAGPYSSDYAFIVRSNIQKAEELGMDVAKLQLDAYPVIPHCNTAHWEGIRDGQYFIDGTLELSRKCDAILVVPGYEGSKGTLGEIKDAEERGVPVFYSIDELMNWLLKLEEETKGE